MPLGLPLRSSTPATCVRKPGCKDAADDDLSTRLAFRSYAALTLSVIAFSIPWHSSSPRRLRSHSWECRDDRVLGGVCGVELVVADCSRDGDDGVGCGRV
jgi:hypothetical protein